MAAIPITREPVDAATEARIRKAVSGIQTIDRGDQRSRILLPADAEALLDFFSIPEVSSPIYSIEKPVTLASVSAHIHRKVEQHARGEGFLTGSFNEACEIVSYMDGQVWPQWAACEFSGAMRPEQQSRGQGGTGMLQTIDWVFDGLGCHLLCFTAALDNERSIRLIDRMGFQRKGEVQSERPDGSYRQSLVWEFTADDWREQKAVS